MRLGNVINVNPESIRKDYPFEEIEYIDISSVGTGTLQGTQHIKLESAPSRAKRIVKKGDTLLAMVRPNLRSFWFARNPQQNTIASTGFAVLRAGQEIDKRFLYFTVTNQAFTDYLSANVKGAAYPAVDTEAIERAEIFLPPLPMQRKIAAILSAYDDLIENNLRRIKILEEMAQNLYREWFVKFRFPGHQNARFVDSPMGRIPEGWEVKTMPNAVILRPPLPVPKNKQIPFVSMGSLANDSMLISEIEYRSKASGARFQNGDTLFARITPCLENGKTGFVQFLQTDDIVACGSTEFIVLRSRTLCPEYVYLMARSDSFRDNAIKSMSGATGRQRVREECFDQFFLAQPTDEILMRFQEYIRPKFKMIQSLNHRNQVLRRTRDLLLPKLISGAVDVSELDISVPEAAA
jgi:type I restriction enzyme S subunit